MEELNQRRTPQTIEEKYNAKITGTIKIPEVDGSEREFLVLRSIDNSQSALYSMSERKLLTFELYNGENVEWFHGWWVCATFPMFIVQWKVRSILSLCDLDGKTVKLVLDEAGTETVYAVTVDTVQPDGDSPYVLHLTIPSLRNIPTYIA